MATLKEEQKKEEEKTDRMNRIYRMRKPPCLSHPVIPVHPVGLLFLFLDDRVLPFTFEG